MLPSLTLRFFASTASVAASRAVSGSGAHPGQEEGKRGMLEFFLYVVFLHFLILLSLVVVWSIWWYLSKNQFFLCYAL
jgi:hypothetical protein